MTTTTSNHQTRPSVSSRFGTALCAVPLVLLLGACSDSNNNNNNNRNEAVPFAEIIAQGVTRYLGLYSPMTSDTVEGVVTHTFGAGDGPLCLDGSEYKMATRTTGSADLVIFLQGGGACWSTLCQAESSAPAGIIQAGILDPNREDNPVKDWNQVYLPYCDGGLHASDKDNDYDNDGIPETPQRGLHNLSAALDVAVTTFPSPNRILLTGASGGAYGTTFALPLVRHLYPDVPIELVNDSGVGIGIPGDLDYLPLLLTDWNLSAFIPESCDDCIGVSPHLTNYMNWQLDEDTNLRRSVLTSKQDATISFGFLQISGQAHEDALLPELAAMEAAHPERFRSWVINGNAHTYVQRAPDDTAGGVKAIDWVAAMINDTAEWVSVSD